MSAWWVTWGVEKIVHDTERPDWLNSLPMAAIFLHEWNNTIHHLMSSSKEYIASVNSDCQFDVFGHHVSFPKLTFIFFQKLTEIKLLLHMNRWNCREYATLNTLDQKLTKQLYNNYQVLLCAFLLAPFCEQTEIVIANVKRCAYGHWSLSEEPERHDRVPYKFVPYFPWDKRSVKLTGAGNVKRRRKHSVPNQAEKG